MSPVKLRLDSGEFYAGKQGTVASAQARPYPCAGEASSALRPRCTISNHCWTRQALLGTRQAAAFRHCAWTVPQTLLSNIPAKPPLVPRPGNLAAPCRSASRSAQAYPQDLARGHRASLVPARKPCFKKLLLTHNVPSSANDDSAKNPSKVQLLGETRFKTTLLGTSLNPNISSSFLGGSGLSVQHQLLRLACTGPRVFRMRRLKLESMLTHFTTGPGTLKPPPVLPEDSKGGIDFGNVAAAQPNRILNESITDPATGERKQAGLENERSNTDHRFNRSRLGASGKDILDGEVKKNGVAGRAKQVYPSFNTQGLQGKLYVRSHFLPQRLQACRWQFQATADLPSNMTDQQRGS